MAEVAPRFPLLNDFQRDFPLVARPFAEIGRRCVTLMSPNKTYNFAGTGCAYAIVEDESLRRAFSADSHATVHDPGVFGYAAALAAYRDDDAWLTAQLEYLRANRDLVEQTVGELRGLTMAHVEATYLAGIDASALGLRDPQAHFLEHGVALSPGAQFGGPGFVRLNFGTQRGRLADALARMRRALEVAHAGTGGRPG